MGKHLISTRYILGLMIAFVLTAVIYHTPYIQTGQAQGQGGNEICPPNIGGNVWTVNGTVHQRKLFAINRGAVTDPANSNLQYKQKYCYKIINGKNEWLPADRRIEGYVRTALQIYTVYFGKKEIKNALEKSGLTKEEAGVELENVKRRCNELLGGATSSDFNPLDTRLLVNEGMYAYGGAGAGNRVDKNGTDHANTEDIRLFGCAYSLPLKDIILLSPYSVVDNSDSTRECASGSWFKDNKYCVVKAFSTSSEFQTKICGELIADCRTGDGRSGCQCQSDVDEWYKGHATNEQSDGSAGVRIDVVEEREGKTSFKLYGCGRSIKQNGSLSFWSFGVDNVNQEKGYGCSAYRKEIQCGSRGAVCENSPIQDAPGEVDISDTDRKIPNFDAPSYEAKRVGTVVILPNTTCGDGRVFRDVIATNENGEEIRYESLSEVQKRYLIEAKNKIEKSQQLKADVRISVAESPIEHLTLVCHDELFGSDFVGPITAINVQSSFVNNFSISPTVLTKEYIQNSDNAVTVEIEVFNGDYWREAGPITLESTSETHVCNPENPNKAEGCYIGSQLLCEISSTRAQQGMKGFLDSFVTETPTTNFTKNVSTQIHDETYKLTCWKCKVSTPVPNRTNGKLLEKDTNDFWRCPQYSDIGVKYGAGIKKGNTGFRELSTKRFAVKVLSDVYLERRLGQSPVSIKLVGNKVVVSSSKTRIKKVFIDTCEFDVSGFSGNKISITKEDLRGGTKCGNSKNFIGKNPLFTVQIEGADGNSEAPVGKRLCWANQILAVSGEGVVCEESNNKEIIRR